MKTLLTLFTMASLMLTGSVSAAKMQWVGPGKWSDATKWSPGTVPTAADTAEFASGNAHCTLDVATSVSSVFFTSAYTGEFHFQSTLTVLGTADFRTGGIIFTYVGILEFAGSAPQTFFPKPSAYTANQIRQIGSGGTTVTANGFRCVNLMISGGVLHLGFGLVDSLAGTLSVSAGGGIDFGTSTLKFSGTNCNLGSIGTLNAGSGTLEFCGNTSSTQQFTPKPNSNHPRILHSGSDVLQQLGVLTCNAFLQTGGTYNINGFNDTITGGNFCVMNGGQASLTGLVNNYIVVQGGGGAEFTGKGADSLAMGSINLWNIKVTSGTISARNARIQNCSAIGATGYAVNCTDLGSNSNWIFLATGQKTWNNLAGGGKWNDASNWAPTGVPSIADSVIFDNGSVPCTLDISPSVKTIRFKSTFTGTFLFFDDTLRITDTADFSTATALFKLGNGALEFIGSGPKVLLPKTGDSLPMLIQNGAGATASLNMGLKTKGLIVKNGVFNCGNAFGDTVKGTLRVESGGTLKLGTMGLAAQEVLSYAGTADFTSGSLTITGPTSNYLQFDNVVLGAGKINLAQSGYWHFFAPPVNAMLPPIYKYGGDSVELMGALKTKALRLSNGGWNWGGSGGRKHIVDTLVTSGSAVRMAFSYGPWDTVKTIAQVDFSGLAATGGMVAGAGIIYLEGPSTQVLIAPSTQVLLPEFRHPGPGTVTLAGDLLCAAFSQSGGVLNTAGYNIKTSAAFILINGTSSTLQGFGDASPDTITAASATLKGIAGDSLNLNRAYEVVFSVGSPFFVEYAKIGNCVASCSTGFAHFSRQAGAAANWKFGKFWKGGGADSSWTTTYNWLPPGAPIASDSVVFDASAAHGCVLNASATVKNIALQWNYSRQFDFGSSTLTVNGSADFRGAGSIVAGTGTLLLMPPSNAMFYAPPFAVMPKIEKAGGGMSYMSDTSRLRTSKISMSGGTLELFAPATVDTIQVASGATLMLDNAIVRQDTVASLSGAGTLQLGWTDLNVSGDLNLSSFFTIYMTDRTRLTFCGNNTQIFTPPSGKTFPFIGRAGSGTTVVTTTGLSADTLEAEGGIFDFGAGLVDTIKAKFRGTGILDFASATLVVTADSLNLGQLSAIIPNTGVIKFNGSAGQTFIPKTGMAHPAIVCNNYSGLAVMNNRLKAASLDLQMGTVHFADPAVLLDTILTITATGAGSKGLNFGNDTVSVGGPVDLTNVLVSSSSSSATLQFIGNAAQNFTPSDYPTSLHPNILFSGSGTLNQTGPLKCLSYTQRAGTYNINGQYDTLTNGNFTVASGTESSFSGLAGSRIVVQTGNAVFSGQPGALLNLDPGASWRLEVSGAKSAQYANIANCDAGGGSPGIPTFCTMGMGNVNWDAFHAVPQLFDTMGTVATVNAVQRTSPGDTVDIFYQLHDGDEASGTVTALYKNGNTNPWLPMDYATGDLGVVVASDSSVHRHIRWHVEGQFGLSFSSDSMFIMVSVADGFGNGNNALAASGNKLVVTTTAPEVSSATLTFPNGNEKIAAGAPVSIIWNSSTVAAAGARLKNLPVTLSYSTDNGATFPYAIAENVANTGACSWTAPALASGGVFVRIAVEDTFGHVGYDESDAGFTVDSTMPAAAINIPENKRFVNSLSVISGIADDAVGIGGVQVSIGDLGAAQFWNGASWTPSEAWLAASGAEAWFYGADAVTLMHGQMLRIAVRVIDDAGNQRVMKTADTVFFDAKPPVSAVTYPASGSMISSLEIITGTAVDTGGGVASVMVSLENQSLGLYWNGSEWTPSREWVAAQGKGVWTLSCPVLNNHDTYVILSLAIDSADNTEKPDSGVVFVYSSLAPGAPGIVFSGARKYTNNPAPELEVSVINSDSMQFRLDAGSWSAWEPYAVVKSGFPIAPGGQGLRKVFAQFKDRAGNVTLPVSDSVVYDAIKPVCAVATKGNFTVSTWPGAAAGTAADSLSGVKSVFYRLRSETRGVYWDGKGWINDSLWVNASGSAAWRVEAPAATLGIGRFTVYVYGVDSAGNAGEPVGDSFIVAEDPVNDLKVAVASVGDSAVSVAWITDTAARCMKSVFFGLNPPGAPQDAAALAVYPYRDTSFTVAHTVTPGTWYAVTRVVDSAGNASLPRKDSVAIMNTPPRLAVPGDTAIEEKTAWTGMLSSRDLNGDSVRYRMTAAPRGFLLDSASGRMQWTPAFGDTGRTYCVAAAYDGRGGASIDTFVITVTMANKPPAIALEGDSVAREDYRYVGRLRLSDSNAGDSAWLSAAGIPSWMRMTADTLSGTPGADDVGTDTLNFIAVDKGGLADTLKRLLIVAHTNHAPEMASWSGPDSMLQYGRGAWMLTVTEKDRGDSLSVTWVTKPQWMNLSAIGRQGAQWQYAATAAPLATDKGWVRFAFSVLDGSNASFTVRDSVFVKSLPTTVITGKRIAFGALRYEVTGGNGKEGIASFEARLRSLDDSSLAIARSNRDGIFEFYPLADGRYEFQARAIDAGGLRDTVPPKDIAVISGASRYTFSASSWAMVSIPGAAYSTAALAQGGHVLHWDETAGEENIYRYYQRTTANGRTGPGQSYWRKSTDTLRIALTAGDFLDSAVTLRLAKGAYGWNQVASPYPYAVKWPAKATVWKWNAATNDYVDAAGILEPWQGYWTVADSAMILRIDNTPVFSSGAVAKRAVAYFTDPSDWQIRVSLFGSEENDADNTLGFSPDAKDGYDADDRPEPPRMTQSGYAFFGHPEWNRCVKEFASDVRNRMKRVNAFQIGVAAPSQTGKPSRIRFQGIDNLASLYCFFADPDTVFRLSENRDYELAPAASVVYKTVFVTADRNFLKNFPLRFALSHPFPNPCRPRAAISYTLPYRFGKDGLLNERPYSVRLSLFDPMGRRVRQLVNSEQEPGTYRVVWDGKSASGRLAATGTYFCRLEAGEYSSTVRLTMMK